MTVCQCACLADICGCERVDTALALNQFEDNARGLRREGRLKRRLDPTFVETADVKPKRVAAAE